MIGWLVCLTTLAAGIAQQGERRMTPDYAVSEDVSPAEAVAALETHRQALIERIEGVQVTWDRQRPLPYFVDAMFDHGLTMAQAELAWIEKFITQVEEQNG